MHHKKPLQALTAALLVLSSAVTHAAPAEPTPAQAVFASNDGYVLVENADREKPSLPPRFCPIGGAFKVGFTHVGCEDKNGVAVDPEIAQQVLDHYFGKGRATVVGLAPYSGVRTTVFYRANRTTTQ